MKQHDNSAGRKLLLVVKRSECNYSIESNTDVKKLLGNRPWISKHHDLCAEDESKEVDYGFDENKNIYETFLYFLPIP